MRGISLFFLCVPASPYLRVLSSFPIRIRKLDVRQGLVAKNIIDATRSHLFTRLQTIPSIVTLFKIFSFLLGNCQARLTT